MASDLPGGLPGRAMSLRGRQERSWLVRTPLTRLRGLLSDGAFEDERSRARIIELAGSDGAQEAGS